LVGPNWVYKEFEKVKKRKTVIPSFPSEWKVRADKKVCFNLPVSPEAISK
jgi:hypothetical protein